MKHLLHFPADVAPRREAAVAASLLMSLVRDLLYVDDFTADLSVRQLRVCALLYEQPRTMSQASRELQVSLSAMTQIADRLERAGYVTRVVDEQDRRVKCLKLTIRGQRAMRKRERVRLTRIAALFERLSPQDRDRTVAALRMLQQAGAAAPGPTAARQSRPSLAP